MGESHHSHLDGARKGGTFVVGMVGAIAVAVAIPLGWVWIASQIAGTKRELTPSLAVLITTGIIVSYWIALVVGGRLRGRNIDHSEERGRVRRQSWNRSFRDEPIDADRRIDAIERVFIAVALIAMVAFEVWFFFFAGDPLPSQPAF